MGGTATVVAAFLAAGLFVFWIWYRRRHEAEDWRRVREVLRAITDGHEVGSVVFSDEAGEFSSLTPLLDRLAEENSRLRKQLTRDEFNLQTILASMQEAVAIVDAKHILRMVNPSFHALFGINAAPVGQSVLLALREPAFDQLVTETFKTAEPKARDIETTVGKSKRAYSVHCSPIRDESGGAGAVVIFRDITRLRQLEDVRREFVANVSHELRTPLSIFHGYVETLVDQPDLGPEDRREIYDVLLRHSLRLNALVEDLLILARLESRHENLKCAPIDLSALLRDAVRDWSQRAAEKSIRLVLEIDPLLPEVQADRLRIEQVIHNLLDNGVKYTEPGGTVTLRVSHISGRIDLRVMDTGIGIPPADLKHIFERFYRADKARNREQGGTGLGLSIVKHIVQSHGGSVHAESTYGKGTAIIIDLPVDCRATAASSHQA